MIFANSQLRGITKTTMKGGNKAHRHFGERERETINNEHIITIKLGSRGPLKYM